MYQVGLMESDRHVQFFWNALESFSQVYTINHSHDFFFMICATFFPPRMSYGNLSSLHPTRSGFHLVFRAEKVGERQRLTSLPIP